MSQCFVVSAGVACERVRHAIADEPVIREPVIRFVTASTGLLHFTPDASTTVDMVVKRVDRALYQAKNEGRNRVVLATSV